MAIVTQIFTIDSLFLTETFSLPTIYFRFFSSLVSGYCSAVLLGSAFFFWEYLVVLGSKLLERDVGVDELFLTSSFPVCRVGGCRLVSRANFELPRAPPPRSKVSGRMTRLTKLKDATTGFRAWIWILKIVRSPLSRRLNLCRRIIS